MDSSSQQKNLLKPISWGDEFPYYLPKIFYSIYACICVFFEFFKQTYTIYVFMLTVFLNMERYYTIFYFSKFLGFRQVFQKNVR